MITLRAFRLMEPFDSVYDSSGVASSVVCSERHLSSCSTRHARHRGQAVVVNGQIFVRPIMVVALTYDPRLIDGWEVVTFLVSKSTT